MDGDVMVGGRGRLPARLAMLLAGLVGLVLIGLLVGRIAGGEEPEAAAPAATATPTPAGDPREVAAAFLDAWAAEEWETLQSLTADESLDAAGEHERAHRVLGVRSTSAELGQALVDGDRVRVPFGLTWDLGDLGDTTFSSEVTLAVEGGAWRVRWWYPTLHPDLTPERRLQRVRVWPPRAPILGPNGDPIVESVAEVVVGVQPGRLSDGPEPVLEALAAHTDADVDEARATLERDDLDPNGFYPLVRLDVEAFAESRDALLPLPGVVTRNAQSRQGDPGVLRPLIGGLGEITGELLDSLGAPYRPGDTVGRSGLERVFERRLAGSPEEEARIVEGSSLISTLAYREGEDPRPVTTTLDGAVQQAALDALAGVDRPAAIVVVHAPTGEVRAAAWRGDVPIALSGRYPPGSSFKIVDTAALLAEGADPSTRMDCPPTTRVGGRDFTNAGDYGPGEIDLREAFARSCNTAYALEAGRLGAGGLAEAAGWFGFDVDYHAGLATFGGSFPEPADAAELAAASIGQGRVEASPLHMASVAAAARSGVWTAPHLARPDEPDDGEAADDVPRVELPEGITGHLDELMREVVVSGTGRSAAVDGDPPVAGKTGSAEFGDGSRTHAWFVGYRGDAAFAVLVEGGGGGGAVAGPIARQLLEALD